MIFDVSGFITAGGLSSRMGHDKAWLEIDDQPLVKRVIAALAPLTKELALIANDPHYEGLGLKVFRDANSGIGPLEGLRTALANAGTSRVVLVGCDLPFVTTELFEFLLKLPGENEVVVPMDPQGKLEPLCAIYARGLLPAVTGLIERGERKVRALFDEARTRRVRFDEIRHLRGSQFFFENINSPLDYERAVRIAQSTRR